MTSINNLKPDHKNARKRTDRSAKLIAESLQRYGAARSIVIDEDNRILAGNGTFEGAKQAGIKNVRVIETDGSEIIAVKRTGLTEDEKVGLALADNRSSDLSDWDAEMLQQLSEEHDIAPWFEQEDLAEIIGEVEQLPAEGNTDPDEVPEAPEEPITKPGDLWILGNHRLLCGDSTNIQHVERLMDGQKADMVFTDPPYGLRTKVQWGFGDGKKHGNAAAKRGTFKPVANDDVDFDPSFLLSFFDCPKVIWGFNHFCSRLPDSPGVLVWDKRDGVVSNDQSDAEIAWTDAIKTARVFRHLWNGMIKASEKGEARIHPTQKPVVLAEWAFELLDAGVTIADLYGGSGSTLIACEKTSRHCRMMELDPAYCDVIVKRWEDFTGNKAILEESPEAF